MNKKTILIVDDTFENLYLLRVILKEEGYNVLEATNGSEGLEKLQKNSNVDLIISDILMPIMDGYLFCQACQKEKLFESIPFVFYTSTYTERSDEELGLKLGAAQFLRKPIDHDELLLTVNHIFNNKEEHEERVKKEKISENEVLKLYSERLINKLEQKSLDLGNEVLEREKAQKLLIHKNEILDLISVNTPLNEIFDQLLLNFQSIYPDYIGSISLLDEDGKHLNLESAPSLPISYSLAIKRLLIGKSAGSCGTAAFTKKPVIVADISTDKLWLDYKDLALKHHLKSCWSIPIFSKDKKVLGTFAIYSKHIKAPSLEDIHELNFTVNLVYIAIEKSLIEAEIKKKDESYIALIDQASDAIISYSLDGEIHLFNKATYINLSYTKSEFLKLKIQDLIVGDFMHKAKNHNKLLLGEAVIFARKLKRKDRSLLDVEVSAKLQKDGKILAIARDVTKRKEAERKLKESEYYLRQSQTVANIGSYVLDLNTGIWEGSAVLNNIFGIPETYVKTIESWGHLIHPDEKDEMLNYFKKGIGSNVRFNKEYRLLKPNTKEEIWIHGIGEWIFDKEGNAIKLIGTMQDITERRKAETDLKLAKEFNDKLVMSMQEGLLILDMSGNIIKVNDSLCKLLGYSKKELIGLEFPHPFSNLENYDKIQELKEKVAKEEAPFFQLELVRKNGTPFLASFLSGTIKNDNGDVIAIFTTIKDISEEEKAKRVLEDNAKKSLERKNVIIELASLVGSDYKDALNKITALSAKTLNIERGSIHKFNKQKTAMICEKLYTRKSDDFESGQVLSKIGNERFFDTLIKNTIVTASHALTHELSAGFLKDYLIPLNIKSKLSIPIQGIDEVYGILCFEEVDNTHLWTTDEEEFATSIANLVSLMIQSAERKLAEKSSVLANNQLTIANKELHRLRNQLEQENVYLRNELDLVFNYEEMIYGSNEFSNVLTEVEKVAPTNATVLLLGESGTGKELLARAIHNTSLRNNKPLIKVNCSAIPRELIESELFGHKKGSFTGAISDKIGKFELADKGTLFLDEIGELPLDMQPKILRFLQEGEIEVVGGTTGLKKLDVRVIAATNRNLKDAIEKKEFREDLYFRLNVFPIEVPPLRGRKDDIPLLIEHFVDKFNKAYGKSIKYITDDAMSQLKAYKWPGNIRELENLIERASILSNTDTLAIPGFESSIQKAKPINNKNLSLDAVQRNHIIQVLEQCKWKISGPHGAAVVLNLKASTLRDRMTKLNIKK